MIVCPSAVAVSLVGALGAVAAAVVAWATLEYGPEPTELVALTR